MDTSHIAMAIGISTIWKKHAAKWRTAGNEKERALVFADSFDNFKSATCESQAVRIPIRKFRSVFKQPKSSVLWLENGQDGGSY